MTIWRKLNTIIAENSSFVEENLNKITKFTYYTENEEVVLIASFNRKNDSIEVKFLGVEDLKVNADSSDQYFYDIGIDTISDSQLENINYYVEDYESQSIRFYCREIEVMGSVE